MTRVSSPSFLTEGISLALMSRYAAGFIFSFAGRLSQSWKPRMRPSVCCGISEWMMPRAALIHWTSPGPRSPVLPWSSTLDVARAEVAGVAVVVLVLHVAVEHVGHRLEAAVRMRRKACERSEERRVGKECRSRWSPY